MRDPKVSREAIRQSDMWIESQNRGRLFMARLQDARVKREHVEFWSTQMLIAANACDFRGMGEAVLKRQLAICRYERAWELVGEAIA